MQLVVFAVVVAAGIGLVVMVVNRLLAHWWVLVMVLVLAVLAGARLTLTREALIDGADRARRRTAGILRLH
ncbi:hypothetical protein [Streptomyces lancefieldiae]|uniref:Uncharacterized protein n=1 Tax=Streptomyces lancefieldiae TaxID=3075520 RepID=A0ABU3AV30_9ACTN|nr:hypothetical protein [Streptomyces sp. DSM 40712]MDT0612676.1 hypothetical protein [Streptomyces sp. DSM 40712]